MAGSQVNPCGRPHLAYIASAEPRVLTPRHLCFPYVQDGSPHPGKSMILRKDVKLCVSNDTCSKDHVAATSAEASYRYRSYLHKRVHLSRIWIHGTGTVRH